MSAAIPPVKNAPPEVAKVLQALKENVEHMRGRLPKQTKIKPLDANASDADVIAKVNEILALLQP